MKNKKAPTLDLENILVLLIEIWRRFRKEKGPLDKLQTREFRSVVEGVQKLQEEQRGKESFADPHLLGAYLLYHWVIHYQQAMSLLGELPNTPKRVLDVCSGPAPMAFAALRHGASEVYAVDRNASALQLGAEICGRYGMPIQTRVWDCLGQKTLPVGGSFDLIILGHCLEELFQEKSGKERQYLFVKSLLERLNPTGHLLLVGSSYSESNQRILQLRDRFVGEGIAVQAPCVWRGSCPALQTPNSPCYAQREMEKPYLIKEIQRAAQINLSSLKMTYLILKSPGASWPESPQEKSYRVISPPFESHFGVGFYLCGTDGKKRLGSRLQKHPKESKAFEYLRRGELISFKNAFEQHNSIEIVEGTSMSVEAPCGKPLPEKMGEDNG